MRDIFSFFEKPKPKVGEVPATPVETLTVIAAYLQAMGVRLGVRDEQVGASPMATAQITETSYGEIKGSDTIDEATLEPVIDGLCCPKVFGPTKNYECACGKYTRMKHRGIVCDVCLVEVIASKVRRERFGHVALPGPCVNPLFLDAVATLLERSEDDVRTTDGEVLRDALASLDLETIEAMEAGPRADLAASLLAAQAPATALVLEVLPVLPPDLRPLIPLREGWAVSDINTLYQRVVECRRTGPALQEAVDHLFINEWSDRPARDEDGRMLKSLASTVDAWAHPRLVAKTVDYSGVAHLTVDPTLSPEDCRVPHSMLLELYKPRAFGLLESRGYCTTIKSARRLVEAGKPEAMKVIEEASEGAVVLLATGDRVVSRRVRAWDAPAIAVDESTAQRLDSLVVTVHVPLSDEAALQSDALGDHARPNAVPSSGWVSNFLRSAAQPSFVEVVVAAVGSGERDPMDDPLATIVFGRPPTAPDDGALAAWREGEQARQAAIRARQEADVEQASANGEVPDDSDDPILAWSVDGLEVSARLAKALQTAGVRTIRDVCRRTEAELLKTNGFGRRELKELKEWLSDYGLSLGMRV